MSTETFYYSLHYRSQSSGTVTATATARIDNDFPASISKHKILTNQLQVGGSAEWNIHAQNNCGEKEEHILINVS